MQDFMQMLSRLRKDNNNALVQRLITSKARCALFLQQVDNDPDLLTVGGVLVKRAKEAGFNLCYILVFDGEKTVDSIEGVPLAGLHEVPSLAGQIDCCISAQNTWLMAFSAYFRRYGLPLVRVMDTEDALNVYYYFIDHLPEIYEAYTCLHDDESRSAYRGLISGRVSSRLQDCHFATEPQYFLHGFSPGAGDIAIDGGAYDGATSLDFAAMGAKVYAFEMDGDNYLRCRAATEGSSVVAENMGLGESRNTIRYMAADVGSNINAAGDRTANIIDIDTYAMEKQLPRIDYIKLDVEGAEMDTLKGAARSISKWKPRMAISAYHKLEDMWTLVRYVKSLRPDYEFAFRHYRIDVHHYLFDDRIRSMFQEYQLELLIETEAEAVLYCR